MGKGLGKGTGQLQLEPCSHLLHNVQRFLRRFVFSSLRREVRVRFRVRGIHRIRVRIRRI